MTVQKIKSGRIPGLDADNFVGDNGQLFFNEGVGDLRLGDGVTPGGIPLSVGGGGGGGDYTLPTASTTIKGGIKIDGTTIAITNQVIRVGTVPYSSLSGTPTIPTNTNQLTNGSGFITTSALSGYATESYVTTRGYLTAVSWNDVTSKPTFATVATSGSYADLTNKPTLFSGSYADLTNKPTIPTNTNELTNGAGYITSSALTGYATESYVTNQGYITSAALSGYALTTAIPIDISDLTDTTNLLGSGGGAGRTTYITNNVENPFSFSVAGDDSTLREISNGESIKFSGAGGVTVTTDAEGNITITGPSLAGLATETYVTTRGYITSSSLAGLATETYVTSQGYITSSALTGLATETFVTNQGYITGLSWNDLADKPSLAGTYTFNVAADDSTLREISSDETVKFIGAGGVTTASDAEGNITITGPSLAGLATETYVTTRGYLTTVAYADITNKPTFATVATSGSYTDLTNRPAIPSIGNLTFVGNVVDSQDSSEISFTPSVSFDSNLTVGGDLLPNISLGGNLGSPAQQWRSLYVSASTIFIGNTSLSAKEDGLQVGGTNLATETFVEQRVSTAVSDLLNGANTAYNTLKEIEQFLLAGDTVVAGIISTLATKANSADLVLTIAGDDSTEQQISIGEGIRLQGTGNITITTDLEGKVTINGAAPDLSAYALTANVPTATSDLTNDSSFITSPLNANGTLSLPILSAEPANLQAGQIALANGTTWDPLAKNDGKPYMAIYAGSVWIDIGGLTRTDVYTQILELG
jgi:hypothetical protein